MNTRGLHILVDNDSHHATIVYLAYIERRVIGSPVAELFQSVSIRYIEIVLKKDSNGIPQLPGSSQSCQGSSY